MKNENGLQTRWLENKHSGRNEEKQVWQLLQICKYSTNIAKQMALAIILAKVNHGLEYSTNIVKQMALAIILVKDNHGLEWSIFKWLAITNPIYLTGRTFR